MRVLKDFWCSGGECTESLGKQAFDNTMQTFVLLSRYTGDTGKYRDIALHEHQHRNEVMLPQGLPTHVSQDSGRSTTQGSSMARGQKGPVVRRLLFGTARKMSHLLFLT